MSAEWICMTQEERFFFSPKKKGKVEKRKRAEPLGQQEALPSPNPQKIL